MNEEDAKRMQEFLESVNYQEQGEEFTEQAESEDTEDD